MAETYTREDMRVLAQEAANNALAQFFTMLDIDLGDKDSVRKLRDDLSFLTAQREGSALMKETVKKSAIYVMSAALLGLTYFLWDIFKDGFLLWLQNIR